jgi:hypothetical protein
LRVHVSVRHAESRPVLCRCLERKSERAPGSTKAKRPDCPAKVDKFYIRGDEASYKSEVTIIPGTRCAQARSLLLARVREPDVSHTAVADGLQTACNR